MHPMEADPNIPLAAFAEYAADRHWVTSHLLQLLGALLITAALVSLSRRLEDGPAAEWATLAKAGAIASMAAACALQAVDGIALKAMVDTWAAIPEAERARVFPAVLGVRQVEAGLASVTSLLFGVTITTSGIALLRAGGFPRWLGAWAVAAGTATAIAGIAMAYTGFSPLAMMISMPAGLAVIVWILLIGIYAWRRSAR